MRRTRCWARSRWARRQVKKEKQKVARDMDFIIFKIEKGDSFGISFFISRTAFGYYYLVPTEINIYSLFFRKETRM